MSEKATRLRRLLGRNPSFDSRYHYPTRMKSSRRSRLASNGSSKRSKPTPMSPPKSRPQPQPDTSPTHPPPPQQVQDTTTSTTTATTATTTSSTSLTAADRYQKNLNSLRRIDPTIFSIIDQFSHICLYRLHDGKWQKDGFEGASFLFERCVPTTYYPNRPPSAHSSDLSELRIPLTASSSSIVQGCTTTSIPSIPKTKYKRKENI